MRDNGSPRSAEWKELEANALDVRRRIVRTLRRELVHDARAGSARLQNLGAEDLADEAFAWALENWKAKPAAVTPEQWMRKRGLQILDESLDVEALAGESRAEERAAEGRVHAHDLARDDDDERAGWLDIAVLAKRRVKRESDGGQDDPFDDRASDPLVSSPADRLDERETLIELERALLALPERRRRVVAHRHLDGLGVEEIAYLLDAPTTDVRRELAKGLGELQSALRARATRPA